MKATIQSRVLASEHTPLEQVIPLQAPYVILVDPSNTCNLSCRFCPTGNKELIRQNQRPNKIMPLDLFKKIINDLSEFPQPIKIVRLYKEGEPLMNKHFPEMVSYAKHSEKVLRVDTTSNGHLLNPEVNRKIVDAGLDRINISVNGVSAEQIEFYTGTKVDFAQYVKNIRDLYNNKNQCEIYIKAIQENLSNEEQKIFLDLFGEYSDYIFLERLSPAWPDFKFNTMDMKFATGHYGQQIRERMVCPNLFYTMVINSDGTVSACVGDWARRLIVGDSRIDSVHSIWLGSKLNKLRIDHLEMKRKSIPFCDVCEVVSHGTLEDIDDYAHELLARFPRESHT